MNSATALALVIPQNGVDVDAFAVNDTNTLALDDFDIERLANSYAYALVNLKMLLFLCMLVILFVLIVSKMKIW